MDILIALAIFGVILWLILQLPMEPFVRTVIKIIAIFLVIFWLLRHFPQYNILN